MSSWIISYSHACTRHTCHVYLEVLELKNGIFMIFSQHFYNKILSGRLLLIVIVREKK